MISRQEAKLNHEPLAKCPRCHARLFTCRELLESNCFYCGFADYSAPILPPGEIKGGFRSLARVFFIRYKKKEVTKWGYQESVFNKGFPLRLRMTTKALETGKVGNTDSSKIILIPTCPFDGCGDEMAASSLSGKRRDRREERYKCPAGHRISLFIYNNPDAQDFWQ